MLNQEKKKRTCSERVEESAEVFISVDPCRFHGKGDIGTGPSRENRVSTDGKHSRKTEQHKNARHRGKHVVGCRYTEFS